MTAIPANPAVPLTEQARRLQQAMIGAAGPEATGFTAARDLPPAPAERGTVAVLGAGIAGLTVAYELRNRGYDVVILEATERAGGRNRTARRGDVLFELDDKGGLVQTHECRFDHGLYLNLGPGRIPYHHRRVLDYCYDFGVTLEPYIMETTAAFESLHIDGTPVRWRNRQVANDTRGYIAALLAEFVAEKVPRPDPDNPMLNMLRVFGALDEEFKYHGSTRSGYAHKLEVNEFEKPIPPLKLQELIASRFWERRFYQPVDYLWQGTMFQPVGGMDQIVKAFEQRVGRILRTNAEVVRITLADQGVEVHYRRLGRDEVIKVDYCVSNIPAPVLCGLALENFSEPFLDAIGTVPFEATCKVGWQAEQRFWENDDNQVYGGISWTDDIINQVWFPSNDYFSARGTLTGAYNFSEPAEELGRMHPLDRLTTARDCAKRLHPQFADDGIVPLDKGLSIAWHKVPFQLGGFAAWDPADPDHQAAYKQLLTPEGANGCFFVTGDQASPLPGWQEGAMMSAHYVLDQILGVTPLEAPEIVRVPDATALTQGLH
jgi:monoamine oxidase